MSAEPAARSRPTPTAAAGRPVPPIRLLQTAAFVATFDRFTMAPMLVAIAADLGVSLGSVVRAAGTYFLVYGISQPVWGIVSDRLGRVMTMRLTLLGAGLCAIASAASPDLGTFAATRGLAGGLFGATYPAALIYLGDTVPPQVRQRDVARLMVGVALGTGLASVGAGLIAQVASWRIMFTVTGLCALAVAWWLRSLPEPSRPRARAGGPHPIALVLRSPTAWFIFLCALAEGVVLTGTLTLVPAAMEHDGASSSVAGLTSGVYGAAVFGFAIPVARLSQRWPAARLIPVGAAAATAACALLAWSAHVPAAVGAAVLLGLAWAAMHSTLQTWATEALPHARAFVVSLFAGSLFVGSSLAALVGGGRAGRGRYDVLFLISGIVAVPLGIAATTVRSRWHGAPGTTASATT